MSADPACQIELEPADRAMLAGEHGGACQLAMKLIVQYAAMLDARRLISVTCAHIDGCLYHGVASLDFARRLVELGGKVRIPTTLNVSSLDRLHPELYRGDPETARESKKLMDAYEALGCKATWTCAPYQMAQRPKLGEQIAWAESNAIVFANSVMGARTNRYGDFLDICAALTGRVPDAGLHQTAARRGQIVFSLESLSPANLADNILYPLIGYILGVESGSQIPVIVGLPGNTTEDDLKAIGATAASSGCVAMFHAVGLTPEAQTLADALHHQPALRTVPVTADRLDNARRQLNTLAEGAALTAVSLGTPHFSMSEFSRLMPLLASHRCHSGVECFVNTSRAILGELKSCGWHDELERFGARIVVDTCTYITPILRVANGRGAVMTNSGKWAHYAPANLGVQVALGSLVDCVASAVAGRVCHK
jgi:predicted aconitase